MSGFVLSKNVLTEEEVRSRVPYHPALIPMPLGMMSDLRMICLNSLKCNVNWFPYRTTCECTDCAEGKRFSSAGLF